MMNTRMATVAEELVPALVDENRKLKDALQHIKDMYMRKQRPADLLEQAYITATRALDAACEIRVLMGEGRRQ